MKFTYLAVAALITALGTGALAQSNGTKDAPAEFPPASFKATQYVDSRGCVYIRAGVDGNTTWIPRLTRQRRHICGMEPTRAAGSQAQPSTRTSARVEQITLDTPVADAPVKVTSALNTSAAPAPEKITRSARPANTTVRRARVAKVAPVQPVAAPAQVRQAAPVPEKVVRRTQAAPARRANAPTPTVANAVLGSAIPAQQTTRAAQREPVLLKPRRTEGTPAPQTAAVRAACAGAPVISSTYVDSGRNIAVRCAKTSQRVAFAMTTSAKASAPIAVKTKPKRVGPLRVASASRTLGAPVPSTSLAGNTRVLPLHVYKARQGYKSYPTPAGYRLAWDDDRLNPHRAEGTLAGRDRMNLVWSNTVPRRLIDRTSGKDVTAKVALVYPFTDFAAQESQLGNVTLMTRNGSLMKRIQRIPGAPTAKELQRDPTKVVASSASSSVVKQVVSTRSKAPAKRHAKAVRKVASTPKRVVKRAPQKQSATTRAYVQVALFGVPENATRTAQRLAGMGLPVRISTMTRSGKSFRTVMAGPFASQEDARRALNHVRSAGFADAYVRR